MDGKLQKYREEGTLVDIDASLIETETVDFDLNLLESQETTNIVENGKLHSEFIALVTLCVGAQKITLTPY